MDETAQTQQRTEIRRLFDLLAISHAVVEFSGGGDEGGTDLIEIFRINGPPNGEMIRPGWALSEPWEVEDISVSTSSLTKLANLLDWIPSWEYGTFAGEFSVSGAIVVGRFRDTVKAVFKVNASRSTDGEWEFDV